MNLKVIATTIAVAAAAFLFSLVSSPSLSLVPTDTVYAQGQDDSSATTIDMRFHVVGSAANKGNQAPRIFGRTNVTFRENSTETVAQYQADDPEKGAITWSLSGPDAGMFEIDEQGNLSPMAAFDFETPASADDSNVHSLKITATDDGEPALSTDMGVSVTVTNVNEAPLADGIPGVHLDSDAQPWFIDLGMYFTDPDGDDLDYNFSGDNITDVALAHLEDEDGILSIDPVSGGDVSFYVVATDSGGLSAVTSVAVSVTEPGSVPTPAPALTVPVPVSTPAPVVVVSAPIPTSPEPELALEPEPTFAPLPPLVERRIHNQTQDSDSVSRGIVAFALEPMNEPMTEVALPPATQPPSPNRAAPIDEEEAGHDPAPQKVAPIDNEEEAGHGPAPQSASLDGGGGELTIWLFILLALVAMVPAGYAVRMYVIHRL